MQKILVIEDEVLVRENIVELLEAEDFQALSSENGRSGIQIAQQEIPDLIICDVMMPEVDGYGVLETLRKNPLTATIPFIFLTAKAAKSDFRQAMELGADDYVTKPFTRAELLKAIASRLQKQAAITQRYTQALKKIEERLNYLIHYDSVTNLPNRLLLREKFNQVLEIDDYSQASSSQINQKIVPILFLELNRLSRIINTLELDSANLLLKTIAHRLISCIESADIVARLNTEQFVIILSRITHKTDVIGVIEAILNSLSQAFIINSQDIFIHTNIGIAFYPDDSNNIDSLVQHAEAAMYQAKCRGGDEYHFYNQEIPPDSTANLELETALHKALERQEFQIYYQPQISLQTGEIVGAEALLRWIHPEWGFVSPTEFIPIAETTGLIIPIGEWVLRTACAQTKLWTEAGFPQFRIAVNLSGRQFNQVGLGQRIIQILSEANLTPSSLELELTESILMQNIPAAIATLTELQSLGIQIAIDDFGTGYSSLSYLKNFPFTTLKIDRCFVHNVTNDRTNAAITTALIQMAHNLNLEVIAEGVETETELEFLLQQRCNSMQGYLFSRPLATSQFAELLTTRKRLRVTM